MKPALNKRLRKLEAIGLKSGERLTDEELKAAIDAARRHLVDLHGSIDAAEASLADSYGADQAREMMAPLRREMAANQASETS
jgi:hypothetical protein